MSEVFFMVGRGGFSLPILRATQVAPTLNIKEVVRKRGGVEENLF